MRKARRKDGHATRGQGFLKQVELSAFAAAVDAFDGDESACRCEHWKIVYRETGRAAMWHVISWEEREKSKQKSNEAAR